MNRIKVFLEDFFLLLIITFLVLVPGLIMLTFLPEKYVYTRKHIEKYGVEKGLMNKYRRLFKWIIG